MPGQEETPLPQRCFIGLEPVRSQTTLPTFKLNLSELRTPPDV